MQFLVDVISRSPVKFFLPNTLQPWKGGGGEGCTGFQVTGIIDRFFLGLKFLILGFFGVGKFGKYFLGWLDK